MIIFKYFLVQSMEKQRTKSPNEIWNVFEVFFHALRCLIVDVFLAELISVDWVTELSCCYQLLIGVRSVIWTLSQYSIYQLFISTVLHCVENDVRHIHHQLISAAQLLSKRWCAQLKTRSDLIFLRRIEHKSTSCFWTYQIPINYCIRKNVAKKRIPPFELESFEWL